jgi:uncharacterized protein (TIGR02452 family)
MANRAARAAIAAETVEILRRGEYVSPSGRPVSIREPLAAAVARTVEHDAGWLPPAPARGDGQEAQAEVANETTLQAARRLSLEGLDPIALVFASARHPGGGFLAGSEAQEEAIARATGLHACLEGRQMYAFHAQRRDPLYAHWAIYAPGVPVLRADSGELLEEPWTCAFLASPAVNAGVAREHGVSEEIIRGTFRERVRGTLGAAAHHGHRAIVLGAWGCGVFRNDPEVVAVHFQEALRGHVRGAFDRVAFAVLDGRPGAPTLAPFARRFRR